MHWFREFQRFSAALRRKDPAVFEPAAIAKLDRAAGQMFPGSTAAVARPVARDTYELNAILLSAAPQSAQIPIDFPGPVDIVGVHASIVDLGAPGPLPAATLDDIRVAVQVNDTTYRTVQRSAGGSGNNIVLSAFVEPTRVYSERIDNEQPRIAATFSWRLGQDTRRDTAIALSFFTRPIR